MSFLLQIIVAVISELGVLSKERPTMIRDNSRMTQMAKVTHIQSSHFLRNEDVQAARYPVLGSESKLYRSSTAHEHRERTANLLEMKQYPPTNMANHRRKSVDYQSTSL